MCAGTLSSSSLVSSLNRAFLLSPPTFSAYIICFLLPLCDLILPLPLALVSGDPFTVYDTKHQKVKSS